MFIKQKRELLLLMLAVFVFGLNKNGQAQSSPIIKDSNISPLTTTGGFGITASSYNAGGIDNRRAPFALRTNANVNFSFLGFKSGLNLLYSTDQTGLRQNMNALSFDANYKYLTVQAGTVNPNYSEYGVSGITIRGGSIKIEPGKWFVEFAGGQSQRAVKIQTDKGFRDPAFERFSFAGKIGVGEEKGSFFHLSSHFSKDDVNSIDSANSVAPQQNLTISPDAQVILLNKKLTLSSNVTISAYTRDLNSDKIPTEGSNTFGFISRIFTPHTSSRINYAGKAAVDLKLQNFGVNVGYERIQPGFRSLGVGRIRDDHQTINIGSNVQLMENKLGIQANVSVGQDNLLGNRLQTATNTGIGTNVRYQFTEMISLNTSYNLMLNDFSSKQNLDTLNLGQQQVSHTIMIQPNFVIQANEFTHSISVSGSYFNMNNEFKGATNNQNNFSSDTYSSSLAYSLRFPAGFSINTMGNFLVFNSKNSTNVTMGTNVGASYAFLDQKMNVSLNAGLNQNKNEIDQTQQNMGTYIFKTRQIMMNLSANYRLYDKGSLSFSVRNLSNNIIEGRGAKYSEIEGNLVYRHRF